MPRSEIGHSWHLSAGFVGNSATLVLNGIPIGETHPAQRRQLPSQGLLQLAPVPPNLLRAGTNVAQVWFHNDAGTGGILGGPVGLIRSETIPSQIIQTQGRSAVFRGSISGLCFLLSIAATAAGLSRLSHVGVPIGISFLMLGLLNLLHSSWLPTTPALEWLRFAAAAGCPASLVLLVRKTVGGHRRIDFLTSVAAVFSIGLAASCFDQPSYFANCSALYIITVILAVIGYFRRRTGPLDFNQRAVLLSVAPLFVAGFYDSLLRNLPLIPWARLWWDPMQWAIIHFLLVNAFVLIRHDHGLRMARSSLHQRLLNAESDQRRELATQLHDEVLQDLIYLKLRSDTIPGGPLPAPVESRFQELSTGIAHSIRYLRQIMENLQPLHTQGRTLIGALQGLERSVAERYGLRTTFHLPDSLVLDHQASEALYRTLRELVQNACKHSHCRGITLTLSVTRKDIEARVQDDGIGFDPEGAFQPGHGLLFTQDRIRWLDGSIRIQAKPGSGTDIRITLPLPKSSIPNDTPDTQE